MSRRARLAVDVGTVRIGVAVAPAGTALAVPVETVARGPGDIARLAELVAETGADTVYVGDPITLAGDVGPAAEAVRSFAADLAAAVPEAEVRMVDERLSTAVSHRALGAAGRNTRTARSVVDQQAAVAILQNALDMQMATGTTAGTAVRTRGSET
jgi:putative Holliday junction resolvase